MKFRTEYMPGKGFALDVGKSGTDGATAKHGKGGVSFGSCFAQNISLCLETRGWDWCDVFGPLFNPLSIARVLGLLLAGDQEARHAYGSTLFEEVIPDGTGTVQWCSWLGGKALSAPTFEAAADKFMEKRWQTLESLKKGEVCVITFGTAWCYFLKGGFGKEGEGNGTEGERPCSEVVGNCHRQLATLFERRLVGIEEMVGAWRPILEGLHSLNAHLKLSFTVSPVRHLRDGFEGNSLSKATLRLFVERLLDECAETGIEAEYFPAYEILMDDLRDYRFYADDLLHPSGKAVEYIVAKYLERHCPK